LELFFLRSAHRFFIMSDRRCLPAGVKMVALLFGASGSMRNSTPSCGGF